MALLSNTCKKRQKKIYLILITITKSLSFLTKTFQIIKIVCKYSFFKFFFLNLFYLKNFDNFNFF